MSKFVVVIVRGCLGIILGYLVWGPCVKISRIFGRGTKVPRKYDMGVSKFLGYLVGGTRLIRGCQIS